MVGLVLTMDIRITPLCVAVVTRKVIVAYAANALPSAPAAAALGQKSGAGSRRQNVVDRCGLIARLVIHGLKNKTRKCLRMPE